MLNVGDHFKHKGNTYIITKIDDLSDRPNTKRRLGETGKDAVLYDATKVLKNGKLSKTVGSSFARFVESGKIIDIYN